MLDGIDYWDELKDSPSQMETSFAIFANILELDDTGEPVNEKYAEKRAAPGCTSTARARPHRQAAGQDLRRPGWTPIRVRTPTGGTPTMREGSATSRGEGPDGEDDNAPTHATHARGAAPRAFAQLMIHETYRTARVAQGTSCASGKRRSRASATRCGHRVATA